MVQRVGIDFGTTNSLISVVTKDGKVKSFTDTGSRRPHPSVVSYDAGEVVCGTKAKKRLDEGGIGVFGSTVRGPKKFIDSENILVGGINKNPKEIVTDLLSYLVNDANDDNGASEADFTDAVVTIPVAMNGRARKSLREAFLDAGIRINSFVHEPLAALYGYYKDKEDPKNALIADEGKYILVFDWGGGTLDLTLCQIRNSSIVQVMNRGNNKVGGDYLDEAILSRVENHHADKFSWTDETKVSRHPGMRARLLEQCEKAKIDLSRRSSTYIVVSDYYNSDCEEESEIEFELTRTMLEEISSVYVNQGINEIQNILSSDQADMDHQSISLCLATGGMVNMPVIENRLRELFAVQSLEVSKKGDRIISEGAAWIAKDDLCLSLAKPFEVVEARNSLLTLLPEGAELPKRGNNKPITQSFYCADPSDGQTCITFTRPQMIGKSASTDRRTTYTNLNVSVNPDFPPLKERIEVKVVIDEDYIVNIFATSQDGELESSTQVYDLEFALQTSSSLNWGQGGKVKK